MSTTACSAVARCPADFGDDPLLLRDVPQVETVQVEISNLIFNDIQGAIDADPTN